MNRWVACRPIELLDRMRYDRVSLVVILPATMMSMIYDRLMYLFAIDSIACGLVKLASVVDRPPPLFASSIRPGNAVPGREFHDPIDVLHVPRVLSTFCNMKLTDFCLYSLNYSMPSLPQNGREDTSHRYIPWYVTLQAQRSSAHVRSVAAHVAFLRRFVQSFYLNKNHFSQVIVRPSISAEQN